MEGGKPGKERKGYIGRTTRMSREERGDIVNVTNLKGTPSRGDMRIDGHLSVGF